MSEETGNKQKRSGVIKGIATVLNSCGSAVVVTYDGGAKVLSKVFGAAKNLPSLPKKAKGLVTGGLGVISSSETDKLYRKIKEYEAKARALYYEIGKTSSKLADANEAVQDSDAARELLARVKEYEKSISELKKQIVDLEAEKKAAARRREQEERFRLATLKAGAGKKEKTIINARKAEAGINSAIKDALIHGDFESTSDREIFDKIATDLLDSETEIKMLAAAELGKTKNKAAVPVLHAALGLGESSLSTEIINSLTNIGDHSSVKFLVKSAIDDNHRVRIASLRGLYKLAPADKELRPTFIEALRDGHPEVRKTAATLIGWLDEPDAVPAMVQCLNDEDEKVRKAVISALANIRDKACILPLIRRLSDESLEIRSKALDAIRVISGEDISFNVNAVGDELETALADIKSWWQDERISEDNKSLAETTPAAEKTDKTPTAAAAEPEAETAEGPTVEKAEEYAAATTADADETAEEESADSDKN